MSKYIKLNATTPLLIIVAYAAPATSILKTIMKIGSRMIFRIVPSAKTFIGKIVSPSPERIDRKNIAKIINTDPNAMI